MTAPVTVATAVISPARPKDPVIADTSRTTLSEVMDIGIRASRPARENARARGSASSWRYGPSPAATICSSLQGSLVWMIGMKMVRELVARRQQ